MKKFLVLLAIGLISSSAMGAIAFTTAVTEVSPSDTITIYLHSDDNNVFLMQMDVQSDNGGTASNPVLSTAWSTGYEGYPSGGDVLYLQATMTGTTQIGGNLWQFEYHVPDLPGSSEIVISSELYQGWDTNFVATMVDDVRVDVVPESLTLHITPEPMTMGLLAIGGLLALRRRR
jgi:hypothetical protein